MVKNYWKMTKDVSKEHENVNLTNLHSEDCEYFQRRSVNIFNEFWRPITKRNIILTFTITSSGNMMVLMCSNSVIRDRISFMGFDKLFFSMAQIPTITCILGPSFLLSSWLFWNWTENVRLILQFMIYEPRKQN